MASGPCAHLPASALLALLPVGPRACLGKGLLRPFRMLWGTGHGAPSLGCSGQAGTDRCSRKRSATLGGS